MTTPAKGVAAGSALAVAIAGYIYVASTSALPVPTLNLTWDDANPANSVTAEFWATTNLAGAVVSNTPQLAGWYLKTNVPVHPGSNFIRFPQTRAAEFFVVRNRQQIGTNVLFSDWSRKTNL